MSIEVKIGSLINSQSIVLFSQLQMLMNKHHHWHIFVFSLLFSLIILSIRFKSNFNASSKQSISSIFFREIDSLWPASIQCRLDSVALALGSTHTYGFDLRDNGSYKHCVHCHCSVAEKGDENVLKCYMHDCPFRCEDSADFDPHPCCRICPAYRNTSDVSEAPLAIDSNIPLTGDILPKQFHHLPLDGVNSSTEPLAVVGVISAAANVARRRQMRRLYSSQLRAAGVQLVFVLGRHDPLAAAEITRDFSSRLPLDGDDSDSRLDERFTEWEEDVVPEHNTSTPSSENFSQQTVSADSVQQQVDEEAAIYGDILQSDIVEHYHYLTLKTLSLIGYAADRLSRHRRPLVKTDDDVALNVPRLVHQLSKADSWVPGVYGAGCGSCAVGRGLLSWRVSRAEWPWSRFPRFVLGPGYLISGQWLVSLYRRALHTRYLHLEDVFITGVLAEAVGAPRHLWSAGLCPNPLPSVEEGGSGGGDLCRLSACAMTHRVDHVMTANRLRLFDFARTRLSVDRLCGVYMTSP